MRQNGTREDFYSSDRDTAEGPRELYVGLRIYSEPEVFYYMLHPISEFKIIHTFVDNLFCVFKKKRNSAEKKKFSNLLIIAL